MSVTLYIILSFFIAMVYFRVFFPILSKIEFLFDLCASVFLAKNNVYIYRMSHTVSQCMFVYMLCCRYGTFTFCHVYFIHGSPVEAKKNHPTMRDSNFIWFVYNDNKKSYAYAHIHMSNSAGWCSECVQNATLF